MRRSLIRIVLLVIVISLVVAFGLCGCKFFRGKITLTKSGLIEEDKVTLNLSGTDYSQSYTVSASGPTVTWENLEYGTYNLTETPDPENKYSYSATITPEGPYKIGTEADESLSYTLDAVNTPTGEIILTKSGLQGTDKVTFTLTSTSGYSQSYTVSTSSPTATWENLEYGTYNLTETPDPENFYSYSITITPEGPYNIGTGDGDQLVYNFNVENKAERKIVFVSNRNDDDEDDTFDTDIYIMNTDGSSVVQLTTDSDSEWDPKLSPDGKMIAYCTDSGIYTMNSDGSNKKRLVGYGEYPSWSPDGERIIFVSDKNDEYEIYSIKLDGSNIQRITNNNIHEIELEWSPDGKMIACSTFKEGGGFDIFVINADGSGEKRITDDLNWNTSPSWSADSKQIAYTSWDMSEMVEAVGSTEFRIFKETASHEFLIIKGDWESILKLDGSICVIDIESKDVIKLVEGNGSHFGPSWSPDGGQIAFASRTEEDKEDIFIMEVDGTNKVNLTNHEESDLTPSW